MDSCAEAARARDEFGQLQISFSPSGFLYLIPTLHVRTRTTGPHPLRARELTTPHPESLTTRLVPVEVDLKQQIFDVCSSLNNGHSPKGQLRQLCAMSGSQPIYSITSSAVKSNSVGISTPSALAVLRLIAISNFVGCSTGRSAGFSPLRIRPA